MDKVGILTQLLELQGSKHCRLLLVRGSSGYNRRPASWSQHRLVRGWCRHRRHVSWHHRLCYVDKLADCWWPHALSTQTAYAQWTTKLPSFKSYMQTYQLPDGVDTMNLSSDVTKSCVSLFEEDCHEFQSGCRKGNLVVGKVFILVLVAWFSFKLKLRISFSVGHHITCILITGPVSFQSFWYVNLCVTTINLILLLLLLQWSLLSSLINKFHMMLYQFTPDTVA